MVVFNAPGATIDETYPQVSYGSIASARWSGSPLLAPDDLTGHWGTFLITTGDQDDLPEGASWTEVGSRVTELASAPIPDVKAWLDESWELRRCLPHLFLPLTRRDDLDPGMTLRLSNVLDYGPIRMRVPPAHMTDKSATVKVSSTAWFNATISLPRKTTNQRQAFVRELASSRWYAEASRQGLNKVVEERCNGVRDTDLNAMWSSFMVKTLMNEPWVDERTLGLFLDRFIYNLSMDGSRFVTWPVAGGVLDVLREMDHPFASLMTVKSKESGSYVFESSLSWAGSVMDEFGRSSGQMLLGLAPEWAGTQSELMNAVRDAFGPTSRVSVPKRKARDISSLSR